MVLEYRSHIVTSLIPASSLFSLWADPIMVMVVVLIIRDRYVGFCKRENSRDSPLWLTIAVAAFGFLAFLIFILASAFVGVRNKTDTMDFSEVVDFEAVIKSRFNITQGLTNARAAFFFIATVMLFPFAIVARLHVKSDKVCSYYPSRVGN